VTPAFKIRRLALEDDRACFDCGVAALNRYFREQVGQDIRRRFCNCFLAERRDGGSVAGYYTLSAGSVSIESLPVETARRLPRYPAVPVTLVGRLAVDMRYQGRQLGAALLFDALRRSLEAAPASFVMVVDAKDDRAAEFYRRHGFLELSRDTRRLFLPIMTAMPLLG
jgi:ribosomal protein S18 acetylase RimI-like enzyme